MTALFSKLLIDVSETKQTVTETKKEMAETKKHVAELKVASTEDSPSALTYTSVRGAEYEMAANSYIHNFLSDWCGLKLMSELPSAVAATETDKLNSQWDGRYFLLLVAPWVPRALFEMQRCKHVLYGQHVAGEGAGYNRPEAIADASKRQLTPTKERGGVSTKCDYLGVFEYTMVDNWSVDTEVVFKSPLRTPSSPTTSSSKAKPTVRKSLLPRLNERLGNALSRAQTAARDDGARLPARISDVVAVVGVVGQYACKESVNDLLASPAGKEQWPFLSEMMERRRFVFFHMIAAETKTSGLTVLA